MCWCLPLTRITTVTEFKIQLFSFSYYTASFLCLRGKKVWQTLWLFAKNHFRNYYREVTWKLEASGLEFMTLKNYSCCIELQLSGTLSRAKFEASCIIELTSRQVRPRRIPAVLAKPSAIRCASCGSLHSSTELAADRNKEISEWYWTKNVRAAFLSFSLM